MAPKGLYACKAMNLLLSVLLILLLDVDPFVRWRGGVARRCSGR